jgi:glutamyl-tRNA reductase
MLRRLVLCNFHKGEESRPNFGEHVFSLETCQRFLYISYDTHDKFEELALTSQSTKLYGVEAYQYLLEIICGLQSRLLGENEIVHQFKTAYHQYRDLENKCTKTLSLLEKLFKDAKEVRTQYLLGLGQKTYASIARKLVYGMNKKPQVLILGSGQLAIDLIQQFKKHSEIYISARNREKCLELQKEHQVRILPWQDFNQYAEKCFILNTIGTNDEFFPVETFFQSWQATNPSKLFIDLASPPLIQSHHREAKLDYVYTLDDIFKLGAIKEKDKLDKIEQAINFIEVKAQHRLKWFVKKSQARARSQAQSETVTA